VAAVGVTVATVVLGVRAGWPLALCGLLAGALALAMVQVLARGMISPLREMAAAAQAMAKGDYSRRVMETSRDEVGDLARSFNRMASDLAEVDQMRRDLVASVSHELRTPLGALQAALENVVDGVEEPDHAQLETMLRQAERLGRLVEQLLDLSRLEAGVVPLEARPFELLPLLQQAVHEAELHGTQSSPKRVAFDLAVAPAGLTLNGDPERVHQVVANLLDNAMRYSPEGGVVDVRAREAGGEVIIEVGDSGPGIPPAEAARVFERFHRVDTARAHDGGTGFGLAIVRWIVDLHGGSVKVEEGTPSGCRMVVALPAR
jgi:signal transduction histidine kinase